MTECAEACKAIGEAGLELLGELEESRSEAYEDGKPAMTNFFKKGNFNPIRSQL